MKNKRMKISIKSVSIILLISVAIIFNINAQSGGTKPPEVRNASDPIPYNDPVDGGNLEYRMVNLISPWNFMGLEWDGYKSEATDPGSDPNKTIEVYPYWDFEKEYMKAQVRSLQKRNVNAVRIIATAPYNHSHDAIRDLTNSTIKAKWWVPSGSYAGDMDNSEFPDPTNGPDKFQNTYSDYLTDVNNWPQSPDLSHSDLQDVQRCWERLFELLYEIRNEFTDGSGNPEIAIDLCFDLGRIKGACPVTQSWPQLSGIPDQDFAHYYSGSNWLYFKTFYDQCGDMIDDINDPLLATDVDSLLDYLNVQIVEIQNEGDSALFRGNVNQYLLYPTPNSAPNTEVLYETDAQLDIAPMDDRNSKRSAQELGGLMDMAQMIVESSDYLGISHDKVSYGFTSPETLKFMAYIDQGQNSLYRFKILNWHMYSSLIKRGIGPEIDWIRSTMDNFSNPGDYEIVVGEIGYYYDDILFVESPDDNDTIPVYNTNHELHKDYDWANTIVRDYLDVWLDEAERFSTSQHQNLWQPSNACPLTGLGIWASSDNLMISTGYAGIERLGLFEASDSPYRLHENTQLDENFNNPLKAKRNIIAPIARYATQALEKHWVDNIFWGPITQWTSGNDQKYAYHITKDFSASFDFSKYTIEDDNDDHVPDVHPTCFSGSDGGDAWFRLKLDMNIWPYPLLIWSASNDKNNPMCVAIYKFEYDEVNEEWDWEQQSCNDSSGGSVVTGIGAMESGDYLFYVWTENDDNPTVTLSLDVDV